jgi:phosphoglycerate dehydrogenase-like enzyme
MKKLLIPDNLDRKYIERLEKFAQVVRFSEAKENLEILSEINALLVLNWPSFISRENIQRMRKLEFIQSILVGVNHIPIRDLPENVIICSNAGAYSTEVAEYALALLLSAAKKICEFNRRIKQGELEFSNYKDDVNSIEVLEGKNLGIIGYGGIGRKIAQMGRSFGMKIHAYVRRKLNEQSVMFYHGKDGLEELLRKSDFVVLSIPLTKETYNMIGEKELKLMKENCILVNVARGDIVNQEALYNHLLNHKQFRYATDVWWFEGDKETMRTKYAFSKLCNFICTPHISGPTSLLRGKPYENAVENTIRFLMGMKPFNVVRREEY